MAKYAFIYTNVDHGVSLHPGIRGEQNGERLDGGINADIPNDTLCRHVIAIHYIVIFAKAAPEDDLSTRLPFVDDGEIPGTVVLPCDRDGTILVNGSFLAVPNDCCICGRLDFEAMLHANRQLCASTREYIYSL